MIVNWKILFFVLYLVFMLIRLPFAIKHKKTEVVFKKKNFKDYLVLVICGLGAFVLPLFYIFSSWFDSYDMDLPEWFRWIGFVGSVFSLWLFWWVHKTLADSFSPLLEIMKGDKLVTVGPYKYIRHPMYTQIFIWVICQWIVLSNWLIGVVGLISWILLYFVRVNAEEQMLIEYYGDEYLKYMERTGRLLPKIFYSKL